MMVRVLVLPATVVGANATLVRFGRPLSDRVTGPVKEPALLMATETLPTAPWAMVTDAGTARVAGTTVTPRLVARSPGLADEVAPARSDGTPAAVPLMEKLLRPGATDPAIETVIVDVVPVGGLSSASVTGPVKLVRVRVTVTEPWPPWMISVAAGAALKA